MGWIFGLAVEWEAYLVLFLPKSFNSANLWLIWDEWTLEKWDGDTKKCFKAGKRDGKAFIVFFHSESRIRKSFRGWKISFTRKTTRRTNENYFSINRGRKGNYSGYRKRWKGNDRKGSMTNRLRKDTSDVW